MDIFVFDKVPSWNGTAPAGYKADFVGSLINPEYRHGVADKGKISPHWPVPLNDEVFEWIALLESVVEAKDTYTMVELGAGYGRWTARAACALRLTHPTIRPQFIAIEAEPTHFKWLQEHLVANKLAPESYTLVQAPVTAKRTKVPFTIGHSDEWYGQAVLPSADYGYGDWPQASVVEMQSTTIRHLIRRHRHVDLIDMDIQGAELECVARSLRVLERKVDRLYISTHSDEIHSQLFQLLHKRNWWLAEHARPLRPYYTSMGQFDFTDGFQYWLNPRLNRWRGGPIKRAIRRLSRAVMPQPKTPTNLTSVG
jgi:FkbM family methyltransferase